MAVADGLSGDRKGLEPRRPVLPPVGMPSSNVVDWRRNRLCRDVGLLIAPGRSGDTEGLDRRRCRLTPKVANSGTGTEGAAAATTGGGGGVGSGSGAWHGLALRPISGLGG